MKSTFIISERTSQWLTLIAELNELWGSVAEIFENQYGQAADEQMKDVAETLVKLREQINTELNSSILGERKKVTR